MTSFWPQFPLVQRVCDLCPDSPILPNLHMGDSAHASAPERSMPPDERAHQRAAPGNPLVRRLRQTHGGTRLHRDRPWSLQVLL